MSERSRARLWIVQIGVMFLLFAAAYGTNRSSTHPAPFLRLRQIIAWTRRRVRGGRKTLEEFDEGCHSAFGDLALIASRLQLPDEVLKEDPDEASYVHAMMRARGAAPREFEDDSETS